jgi:hypothetical protein
MALGLAALLVLKTGAAQASVAYGTINNFDTVNDTNIECHGFEIELDDIHSTGITYTYDYNHYGIPTITEDDSVPAHPKVFVKYAATYAGGAWSAFTAIPSAPIPPTAGHQFTNPSVNFGGEHFGVGYTTPPTNIVYNWLVDDGSGHLIHGGLVSVSTPVFSYVAGAVQAVIPPPVQVPVLEFGPATWVKEIRTTTHNNQAVKIEDLISKDPDYPNVKDWTNGEPDEVEVEWQILQTDTGAADGGANGKLAAAAENLAQGDEIVTRRYEFYKYTGPLDNETGEALGESVGPDGIHGTGIKVVNSVSVDLSTVAVVGDFLGAQMSAFDVDAVLGLIDHVQDGAINAAYVDRKVVVPGNAAFAVTTSGDLPQGMSVDGVTGILSGTPTASGLYVFSVQATDTNNVVVQKSYNLAVAADGGALPAQSTITTSASPPEAGTTSGGGTVFNGPNVALIATPALGYYFVDWTENGGEVSTSSTYSFTAAVDRTLVANFQSTKPAAPVNSSPAEAAVNQPLTPQLQASAFSDPQPGDLQTAAQWLVKRLSDSVTVYDSGSDLVHLTSTQVPTGLEYDTSYQWQVRYLDSNSTWSDYSALTGFSTQQAPVSKFNPFHGRYNGFFQSSPLSGTASILVANNGTFTANVLVQGVSYRLTGKFTANGTFTGLATHSGLPTLQLSLTLDTSPGAGAINGTISDGLTTTSVMLNLAGYSATHPVPKALAGHYTLVLPPDPNQTEDTVPQGTGYGAIAVTKAGAVLFNGVLGDGTKVKISTTLAKDGTWSFFATPYPTGGSISGVLTFENIANTSDLDGTLTWTKTAAVNAAEYPAGFTLQVEAIGSRYEVPKKGIRIIALPVKTDNASLTFVGPNLSQPEAAHLLTLGTNNVASADPGDVITLKVNKTNGLFTGTFVPLGTAVTIPFAGALLQKMDANGFGAGMGQFLQDGEAGSVNLSPVP